MPLTTAASAESHLLKMEEICLDEAIFLVNDIWTD
jgi:hypothetical protein